MDEMERKRDTKSIRIDKFSILFGVTRLPNTFIYSFNEEARFTKKSLPRFLRVDFSFRYRNGA